MMNGHSSKIKEISTAAIVAATVAIAKIPIKEDGEENKEKGAERKFSKTQGQRRKLQELEGMHSNFKSSR